MRGDRERVCSSRQPQVHASVSSLALWPLTSCSRSDHSEPPPSSQQRSASPASWPRSPLSLCPLPSFPPYPAAGFFSLFFSFVSPEKSLFAHCWRRGAAGG